MTSLHRVVGSIARTRSRPISSILWSGSQTHLNLPSSRFNSMSTKSRNGEDEWNDAWETAWLPDDLTEKNRAPWETDVNFPATAAESTAVVASEEVDVETLSGKSGKETMEKKENVVSESLYSLETMKKDYRLKKQRIHAALWVKEIEKLEEAKLGDSGLGGDDDMDRLLDSYSEIFDSPNHDFENLEFSGASELKAKPDGWETTAKEQDGNLWDMSQREEDILLQEFDRRIAFCKFQIASFIKQHIFSRRRPVDGWRYMIEVIGPNARKGKGGVSRLPALSEMATQPFKEERMQPEIGSLTPLKSR
ncbi:PREDICTED: uncharacterized protein LOC104805152 [Tarenaya hassleriana]|uniref:uncharacterized protein LOC104805152 n=1 Tax=Tarenaya hassleriana TaxID=28532 RepID=UPI00053C957F|nr:PREDICTED: uncharacterized protein LOC104805152 [Tarenaya hassleriana]